jgi:hypothetical protein
MSNVTKPLIIQPTGIDRLPVSSNHRRYRGKRIKNAEVVIYKTVR